MVPTPGELDAASYQRLKNDVSAQLNTRELLAAMDAVTFPKMYRTLSS